MERGSHFAMSRILLSLLLLRFCYPSCCLGKMICPSACQCLDRSADCRGDNGTLARVVQDLPAELESFKFTVFTQSLYTKIYIDLNTVQGLRRFKNLRSFQIQPYVQSAPFTYNTHLQENIFCNWTHLEEIHLNMPATYSVNGSVEPFSCLQHLKVLDFSNSKRFMDPVLHMLLSTKLSRHITHLLLRNVQSFDRDETVEIDFSRLFSKLNRSSLEVIDLSANAIRVCYPGLLLLPNLKKLDLSENLLFLSTNRLDSTFLIEAALHPSLQEVTVADPSLSPISRSGENSVSLFKCFAELLSSCSRISSKLFPQFVSDGQLQLCSMLRQFTENTQVSSQCMYGLQIPLGSHLELFNASGMTKYQPRYMNHMPRGRLCIDPDNEIRTIDVSNMRAVQFLDDPTLSNISITGLTRIKTLNLVNNGLMLENFEFFDGMPSLEQLLLGGNEVQIHLDIKNNMFKFLRNLRHLDLSRNELHSVPQFAPLSKLEHLDLSDNKLSDFKIQLPDAPSLKLLNFSMNGITFLHASIVDQFDRYPHLEVDLQGNSFICNCDALWFVRWVQTTSTNLTGKSVLDCYTEEGLRTITKINLEKLHNRCHPMSQLEVALISVSAAFCFFLLIVGLLVVYRQRWRIRHYWYRLRLRHEREVLNDDYEYDAYVSYSDCSPEVRRWVSGAMHEELECKRGLKLFIHQRDLLGGGFFLERIDVAMRKCRKTILVLSPEFLQSRTCLYEAWSAHTSMVTEDRDAVVLVKLQTLPLAGITGTLASLMQIRDCLNWTNDPIGQNLFWEQLEDVILSVLDSPIIN